MGVPKLVIFDMDGLIFDSERLFLEFLWDVQRSYGYHIPFEQYLETLGLSHAAGKNVMCTHLGANYPYEEISRQANQNVKAWAQSNPMPMKDGIMELLLYLKEQKIPCCLASSSSKEIIARNLNSCDVAAYFDFVLGGDELKQSKPNPEIFLTCCRHFGINPQDALVLEDSPNGVQAAINGKIPVICIPDLVQPLPEQLEKVLFVAKDAFEVRDYFERALAFF